MLARKFNESVRANDAEEFESYVSTFVEHKESMRSLGSTKLWTHLSLASNERTTNKEVREEEPARINTFRELVRAIARIANHNPDYTLFFRGQPKDYTLNSGASSCYPTIYRAPGRSLPSEELRKRFEVLDICSRELIARLEGRKVDNIQKLRKFDELVWSILQHYEVCNAPLLDVTHSLRVAASFALNNASNHAYVYAFALPYPNGTISYSTDQELMNVRLLSACPADALRPHFQEGYLVGSFPIRSEKKQPQLDFARRLVAKIEIPKKEFWGRDFDAIPNNALYPPDDDIRDICEEIRLKHAV